MPGNFFDIDTNVVVVGQYTIANVMMLEENKGHSQLEGRPSPSRREERVAYEYKLPLMHPIYENLNSV